METFRIKFQKLTFKRSLLTITVIKLWFLENYVNDFLLDYGNSECPEEVKLKNSEVFASWNKLIEKKYNGYQI